MNSIAFARKVKSTGYGRDILFSYGRTVNGEVIDFTADRIMSVKLTWAQSSDTITTELSEKLHDLHREDLLAAADATGISTGLLKAERGTAHLFKPIIDRPGAAVTAGIDAVSQVAPEPLDRDTVGKLLAGALDRPSGAHLPGGNIVNEDGTLRAALDVPRLIVVQIFAPGERRRSTTEPIGESTVAAIEKATTLDQLFKVSEPIIEDLASREDLVSDIIEMRPDLDLMTGLLPGADNGLAVPFESTNDGFERACAFAKQMSLTIPDTVVSMARTWKRA